MNQSGQLTPLQLPPILEDIRGSDSDEVIPVFFRSDQQCRIHVDSFDWEPQKELFDVIGIYSDEVGFVDPQLSTSLRP
jgi:hypothetical protein